MTTRRELLVVIGASGLAAPLACFAQPQRSKVARIGLLEPASSYAKGREALIAGLHELGYVEGKNIIIEYRSAEGKYEHLPGLAAEMVQMKVDVIVAATPPAIQAAAQTTGVKVSPAQAGTASQIDAAFGAMKHERAGALIVLPDAFFFSQARRIAELAAQQRLPTMFWTREPVESGGLMSYGQNNAEHYYRAATYVDKILKGAKPADLPVEQPTKIELVINLKTAKAIGLTIPQDLLFRADKVIE